MNLSYMQNNKFFTHIHFVVKDIKFFGAYTLLLKSKDKLDGL